MRIAVIGGGPGGLYFAYLWKKRHPEAQIDLFEQNPAGATWGFGVVFSEQALEFLRADDPDTVDAIAPRMQSWKNITLNLRGESVEIDGVGFSSIGRLDLLTILQARVRAVGVEPRYDTTIQSVDELEGLRPDRRSRWPELAGAPELLKTNSTHRCRIRPTSSPGTAPQSASRRSRRLLFEPISARSMRTTIATRPI